MRITKGALVILLAALAASAAISSFAQTGGDPRNRPPLNGIADCPAVVVSCPTDPFMPGAPLTFVASISSGDPNWKPTYNWTVSAGTITSGQGTGSITVDTTGLSRESVTATVEVGGFDRNCTLSANCTVGHGDVGPSKVDEYGPIPRDDEKARLDNFYKELQNDPTAQGYLVCYGGRRSRAGEARRRCERARDYVDRARQPSRFVTVDGGYHEELTVELWVVPSGAPPPPAEPTVDPSEVRPPSPPRRARHRARR